MPPLLKHVSVAALIAGTTFAVVWGAAFLVLWEFVYGDAYGGRWQRLAWPPAIIAALSATALYVICVYCALPLRKNAYARTAIGVIAVTLVWLVASAAYLMPPL